MAAEKKWFVPDDMTLVPSGPFSSEEIIAKIQAGSLKLDDYIWPEDGGQDWHRLFEVEEFKSYFVARPICKVPSLVSTDLDRFNISQLSAKGQTESDRIEQVSARQEPRQNESERVSKNSDLQNLQLYTKKGEYGVENIYRRFPRVPFESAVILHNQDRAYLCSSIDISEKGISIKVKPNLPFHPSDEVMVTVRNFPEVGTFSTEAVVLRHFKIKDSNVLGFYFLHINPNTRRLIAQYVHNSLLKLYQDQQAI
jgi:hypothetical protein